MSSKPSQKRNRASFENFTKPTYEASPSKKPKPKDQIASRLEPTHDPLWQRLTSLPSTTRDFLLYDSCKRFPELVFEVGKAIEEIARAKVEEERTRPIADFDHLSKECWHLMTNGYRRKSASKMGIGKKKVCEEVDAMRMEILGAAGRNTRFETRRNAVETMRKICKSVVLCKEGGYVRERNTDGMGLLDGFVGSLGGILGEMSERERERFREEGWLEKLVELRGEFKKRGVDVRELEDFDTLFEEGVKERETIERNKRMNAAEERQQKDNEERKEKEHLAKQKIARVAKENDTRAKEDLRRKKAESSAKDRTVKEKKKPTCPISLDSDDDIQIINSW